MHPPIIANAHRRLLGILYLLHSATHEHFPVHFREKENQKKAGPQAELARFMHTLTRAVKIAFGFFTI
jgi:hypothetical protein